ncbi:DUF937 domain-containing protein [Pseudoxanthomonas kaohsiungensis]|uniref:DUF937 domain-containing protein n=1 Tax=Pseudoxanthomonas kaohsiungensis TaxID=283923 RepID=A0ABW3LVH6_9GAMM|nr:DUF937 domain-containing protein [Pseudoxanthomonas kaohsiungensis]KAF1702126.1 calcium-binding protein [Pseudoxanthomonas kaohsiungensis]
MNQPLLTEELLAQLQGAPLQQLSRQLGTDPDQTGNAVAAALPLLLGALGRNSAQPQGAQALYGALQRDHGGGMDLGSVLGAVLGGGTSRQTDGAAILGHVLGRAEPRTAQGLGQATGLGSGQAMQLLAMLAPIVMSFLANRSARQGLDAGGLGELLGQERTQVRQRAGGGALDALLDQDGDGDVDASDLLNLGMGLFGGRR